MTEYSNGKIYEIISKNTDKIYIGSTINNLNVRLDKHLKDIERNHSCSSIYVIELGDYNISLIESYPCSNDMELRVREQYWIDKYISDGYELVNIRRAFRTDEERKEYEKKWYKDNRLKRVNQSRKWREDNCQKIKQKNKEYVKNNLDKIKERQKQYYIKNRDEINEKRRKQYEKNKSKKKIYRQEHSEKIKKYLKNYRENNRDKANQYAKQRRYTFNAMSEFISDLEEF
tara:strand:+ start:2351 stop:3040 length:690 start_codon:yes stop_codon:yes gene_type:complete